MRGPTSEKSLCTSSWERSSASAWRRAWRSPRRPSVIICSAYGFTAFAFASVVLIRPCSISEHVRFAYSAFRCAESRPSFLPVLACRTGALLQAYAAAVVAAEGETVLRQRLLDLLDRLLAEVRDRGQLVLGLHDEVADRLDADALEAVVRAHAQLELLDREVLHPVRQRRLGPRAAVGRGGGLAEALDPVEIGEDRELTDQDLGGLADRVARIDRTVSRDVENQLVVVGALTDASGLDVVRDATHGREDRIDRDDADRVLGPAVELGRDVAAAAADSQRHLELALVGQVRDLEIGIEDLELRRSLDVLGRDGACAALREAHLDLGRVAV